jgi:hypothetical protein
MKIFFDNISPNMDGDRSHLEVKDNGDVLYHQYDKEFEEPEIFQILSRGVIVV